MTYKNIYIAMRELTKTLLEINEDSLKHLDANDNPLTYNYVEGRVAAFQGLLTSFNSMENNVTEEENDD